MVGRRGRASRRRKEAGPSGPGGFGQWAGWEAPAQQGGNEILNFYFQINFKQQLQINF
jgi:hypothetical protein